jgi:hypothetical protein
MWLHATALFFLDQTVCYMSHAPEAVVLIVATGDRLVVAVSAAGGTVLSSTCTWLLLLERGCADIQECCWTVLVAGTQQSSR